jgi:cold shock CspA family protein
MSQVQTDSSSERLTGMVKWFNNKAGFGFITVCGDGEFGGKDIFTHYSSIRVGNSQYKYLVQGEYVDFNLVKSENEKHEYQAVDITGVKGGAIMCETRKIALSTRPERSEYVPRSSHSAPSTEESFEPQTEEDGFKRVERAPRRRPATRKPARASA